MVSGEIVREVVAKLYGEPVAVTETVVTAAAIEAPAAEMPAAGAPAVEMRAEETCALEMRAEEGSAEEAVVEKALEENVELREQPVLRLTYEPAKRFRFPRWALRGFVVAGILFLAGISLTAFMLRLTVPDIGKAPSSALPARAASTSAPASVPGSAARALTSSTADLPEGESTQMEYSADPEEAGAAQIITVAAMPGQTIEELSLSYAGRFDEGLLQQIEALNPEMKDPDHLSAGQLIRLPLPRGSFRKGKDLGAEK
jgi:hypothetical protein